MEFEEFGVGKEDFEEDFYTPSYPGISLPREELEEENKELRKELRKVKEELKELKKSDKAELKEKLERKKERIEELNGRVQKLEKKRKKLQETKRGKEKELQKVEKEKEEIKGKKDRFKEELGEKKKKNLELKQENRRLKNNIPILKEFKQGERGFEKFEELSEKKREEITKKMLRKIGFRGDVDKLKTKDLLYLTGFLQEFPEEKKQLSRLKSLKNWIQTSRKYGNEQLLRLVFEDINEQLIKEGKVIEGSHRGSKLIQEHYNRKNKDGKYSTSTYHKKKSEMEKYKESKEKLLSFLRKMKNKALALESGQQNDINLEREKERKIEEPKEIEERDWEIPIEKWNNLNEQQKKIFNILRKHKRRAEEGKTEFIFDSQTEYRETFNRETKHDLSKSRFSKLLKPIADKLRFKKDGKTIEPLKVEKKGRSKSYRLG